jgi:transposase-like protein
MTGHGAKIGQKMEQAIVALLSHRNIEEAAREVGVSANTMLRWMKEPEFQAACREARHTVFSHAIGGLQDAAGAAATTVLKIMLDPNAPPATRLRAAAVVLDQAMKAGETTMFETTPGVARKRCNHSAEINLVCATHLSEPEARHSQTGAPRLASAEADEEVVE